jgi:prepilin-type N-terminal cleavage/methylation domain-containing protein
MHVTYRIIPHGVVPSPWKAAGSRLASVRGEQAFTLVEMLVVLALLPIVVTAIFLPLEFAQTQTPKTVEYSRAITSASSGLQQMMREIRQAYHIDFATENAIDFNAVINSTDMQIYYECDEPYPTNLANSHASEYRRCLRVSATTGATLPSITTGAVIIDRVLNYHEGKSVFMFKDAAERSDPTNPAYVEARIRVPARGVLNSGLSHTIELDNGTALPNLASQS